MKLKWTSQALSDLARLYEFLTPVNQQAAARTLYKTDCCTDNSVE